MKIVIITLSVMFFLTFSGITLFAQTIVTYDTDIQPIESAHCLFCHTWNSTYAGNSTNGLTTYISQFTVIGLPVVIPKYPDSSILIWRLIGTRPDGLAINRMPKGGPYLPDATITLFKTWIQQGARENLTVDVKNAKWSEVKRLFNDK
jgi:hypothetical protein